MSTRLESLTITSGTAVSSTSFSVQPHERLLAVITPGSWTAADIGFQTSMDGDDFYNIIDPARAAATSFARIVNVEIAASRFYVVPEALDFPLGNFFKITSINTASNVDVNQGSDRALIIIIGKAR